MKREDRSCANCKYGDLYEHVSGVSYDCEIANGNSDWLESIPSGSDSAVDIGPDCPKWELDADEDKQATDPHGFIVAAFVVAIAGWIAVAVFVFSWWASDSDAYRRGVFDGRAAVMLEEAERWNELFEATRGFIDGLENQTGTTITVDAESEASHEQDKTTGEDVRQRHDDLSVGRPDAPWMGDGLGAE